MLKFYLCPVCGRMSHDVSGHPHDWFLPDSLVLQEVTDAEELVCPFCTGEKSCQSSCGFAQNAVLSLPVYQAIPSGGFGKDAKPSPP